MLVVSPTRELAAQIAEEAKQLTAFQQSFTVQVQSPGHAACMITGCTAATRRCWHASLSCSTML